MELKDKKYYESNKRVFNEYYNEIYKRNISYRPFVGSCSYLMNKYCPESYQDFFDKYISDYDESTYNYSTTKGDYHHGRSLKQLNTLSEKYYRLCDEKYNKKHLPERAKVTLEMCFDDIVNHIIIETFDGHQAENLVFQRINAINNMQAIPCEDELDTKLGVDIIVKDKETNKIRHFIQVKPITTFLGSYNQSLINDRKNFFNKQKELNEYMISKGRTDEVKEIEFMCYDKGHYERTKEISFLTKEGKTRFRLDELTDRNGMPILSYDKCIFVQWTRQTNII